MKKCFVCVLCVITLLTGLMAGCQKETPKAEQENAEKSTTTVGQENPQKGLLTVEEASAVIANVNDRYGDIFCYFFMPSTEMSLDQTQTLPDDSDMCLVVDERFPNMQAIQNFLRAVVTDEFIKTQYPKTFNEAYLSPNEAETKGVDYTDYTTVYYEYNGNLYANQNAPIPSGNLATTDWDNPKIVFQSEKEIVSEYPLLFPRDAEDGAISYEICGTVTYTVKKENDAWLLDNITEKDR